MCFWSFCLLRLTFFSISSISSLFSYHILRWTLNLIVNLSHFVFFHFLKLGWFSSPQNSLSPWRLPRSNIASTSHRIQAISAFWHIFFNFWNSYRCVSVFLYCWISNTPWKVKVKVTQSCPTLCDPVHGILQARIMEWVAFRFSRESSQSRDQTQVSLIVGRFFTSWATREAQEY